MGIPKRKKRIYLYECTNDGCGNQYAKDELPKDKKCICCNYPISIKPKFWFNNKNTRLVTKGDFIDEQ